jgi:hypothetical protein
MKLESLEKFSKNEINKVEMNSVFGGKVAIGGFPTVGGFPTGGGAEQCTQLGCMSWTSDWNDENTISYYGVTYGNGGC